MYRALRVGVLMVLFVAVAGMAWAGGSAEEETITFTIQHNSSADHPWQDGLEFIADRMQEEFPGVFNVTIHDSGALADQQWEVILEQTQTNVVQMSIESFPPMATLVPELFALSAPFMFDDMEHQLRFLEDPDVQDMMAGWLEKMEERDLKTIAVWPRPPRQLLNSERPVIVPEDIRGLPFRVPSLDLFVRTFEALGAEPTPMPSGEIYTAMQLGTVVGEDNAIGTVYDFGTYEQGQYFNVWNYMADGVLVNVNKQWFEETLTPEMQDALVAAAEDAAELVLELELEFQQYARQQMEDFGIEFTDFDREMKEPWIELVEDGGIYDMLRNEIGDEDWNTLTRVADETR